jgi:SAM-dependent methyltransferase
VSRIATSNWIPRGRIRVAVSIAIGLTVAALIGATRSWFALALLAPAAGAAWAALVMLGIRRRLSDRGGGVEHRIHEVVVAQLALAESSEIDLLDVGCGAAGLIIQLLERSPGLRATGVDLWGPGWDYAMATCERHVAAAGFHAAFERMDAAELAFPDATFDAVVSVMCFHEVRIAGGKRSDGPLAAVREALRVLRPGGTFVLVDRFADDVEFGPRFSIDAILCDAVSARRVLLSDLVELRWPLGSQRALGPVEVITGSRSAHRSA